MSYAKLFSSILASTIWAEDKDTKILWITMLAMKDWKGQVLASVPGLAKMAGLTLAECAGGLERLLSPDPWSRTKDHEGRRLLTIDGGWLVINHEKYRSMESEEVRRAQMRKASAKYRAKQREKTDDEVIGGRVTKTLNTPRPMNGIYP